MVYYNSSQFIKCFKEINPDFQNILNIIIYIVWLALGTLK